VKEYRSLSYVAGSSRRQTATKLKELHIWNVRRDAEAGGCARQPPAPLPKSLVAQMQGLRIEVKVAEKQEGEQDKDVKQSENKK
jgi:hypothetical protein